MLRRLNADTPETRTLQFLVEERKTEQQRDPRAGVQTDSHPISLLERVQALRRGDLPTCLLPTARRSNSPLKLWNFGGKRCRLLENRDQRGLTEKLRCSTSIATCCPSSILRVFDSRTGTDILQTRFCARRYSGHHLRSDRRTE